METNDTKKECLMVSEASNFNSVFGKKEEYEVKSVVIPLVQRDYAQGRVSPDVNRIRERFLKVLYEALVEDKQTTLDFIYGNVDDNGRLIPLDGQQRLTTLFLLHYYVARHEKKEETEWDFLHNFTYETRVSSREFCEHLLNFAPDFNADELAFQIRDEAWFLLEWENDPTVQSMLVMLDAIHAKFKDTNGLWEKLMEDSISFYFLPLSKMNVTDELYIKMNSRGKPLTRFEHFKAELELKLKEVDEKQFLTKRIMRKIDREWTDILWPYRNSGTGNLHNDAITDDEFLRYIHFISDIISFRNGNSEITDEFDIIDKQFSKECKSAKENILLMESLFDIWNGYDIEVFFDDFISNEGYAANKIYLDTPKNIFRECCKCYGIRIANNRFAFSLVQTILLYAFTLYLRNKESVSEADFRRRIRIVNNLAKNSPDTVRSENMKVLLGLVDKIILNGIIERVEGKARFQTKQVEEEIEKLLWTNDNPEKSETMYKLEDHPFLNGYISSVGLEHIDWCNRFYSLFDQKLDLVVCALLATGDYFVKDAWRFQIGTADNRLSNTVWRDILGPVKLEENLCETLQTLLSKHETFSNEILQDEINSYIESSETMPVRYYITKYPQMRPNRWGKYYWFNHKTKGRNSYQVLMMTTEVSLGGFNYDIFLKTLFELSGGKEAGLELGNYSYTEYNSNGGDKLYLNDNSMFLILKDDTYSLLKIIDEGITEEVENYNIRQNEQGIDIEDRIQVGLKLLEKYKKNHLWTEDKRSEQKL